MGKWDKNRCLNIASCLLVQLLCSNFNLWSTLNVYVYSYLKQGNENLEMTDINQIYIWIIFATSTGIQFGLLIAYRIGFRITIFGAGLLAALSIFVASLTSNFILFTLFFGIASLFFAGLAFLISFDRMFKLFPDNNEMACGFVNLSYGIGLFILGELCYFLVNPDNIKLANDTDFYPTNVSDNLPKALRIVAAGYVTITLAAGLTYRDSSFASKSNQLLDHQRYQQRIIPEERIRHSNQEGNNSSSNSEPSSSVPSIVNNNTNHQFSRTNNVNLASEQSPSYSKDTYLIQSQLSSGNNPLMESRLNYIMVENERYSFHEAKRSTWRIIASPKGIKVFVLLFGVCSFGIFLTGNFKPYGQQFINDDEFLSLVGTVSGMLSGVSGIFWGFFLSKAHFKYVLLTILSLSCICAAIFPFASSIKGVFFFLCAISTFCFGGFYTVLPIMVGEIFGNVIGTKIIGFFYQATTLASLCSFVLLKYVDWTPIFYVYSSIAFASILILFGGFSKKTLRQT